METDNKEIDVVKHNIPYSSYYKEWIKRLEHQQSINVRKNPNCPKCESEVRDVSSFLIEGVECTKCDFTVIDGGLG